MDLFEAVFELYEQIRSKAEADLQDLVSCKYTQQCYSDNGAFCLVLEITVLKNISDDDHGLIFWTDAQTGADDDDSGNDDKRIFLTSDLNTGDKRNIAAMDKLVFDPKNDAEVGSVNEQMEQFIKPFTGNISTLLINGYDIKLTGNSAN